MRDPLRALAIGVPAAVASFVLSGCAAPFSDLQSARTVGPGGVEFTASGSTVSFAEEGRKEEVQRHLGFQLAGGLSERVDLRGRLELIELTGGRNGAWLVVACGPKFGLVPDVLALNVPVGLAVGSDLDVSETLQTHPTLLVTAPVSRHFEINVSGKALVPFDSNQDVTFAGNLGAGLSTDLAKWALRPEVGVLVNPGQDGSFRHLSLGVSVYK